MYREVSLWVFVLQFFHLFLHKYAKVMFLRSILFFLLILAVSLCTSSARSESRQNDSLFHNLAESETGEADSNQSPNKFYAGYKTGLPFFAGVRLEYLLKRSSDMMPTYLIAGDISLTWGFGASLALERRIGHSRFYTGCGYNYTRVILFVSGGDVVVGGASNVHSILLTIGLRTSYQNGNSFNIALGGLITPSIFEDLPVFPVLHLSMIGG